MNGTGRDLRTIYVLQGLRAFLYGFGSVLLGVTLEAAGFSGMEIGVVLSSLLAGSAAVSVSVIPRADRIGRRRLYAWLLAALGVAGTVFALTDWLPALLLAALTGTLSVEVGESGPFTSLEQAMVPRAAGEPSATARAFGTYNAIAGLVGAAGALAVGGPALLRRALPWLPADRRLFLVYPAVALVSLAIARRLSPDVEAPLGETAFEDPARAVAESRPSVRSMAALFALDSFAGGFVVQSFLVFWFSRELGATPEVLGVTFFGVGLLQAASYLLAVRLAARIGLLNTMVFTHLPSNLLLMAIPLAPSLPVAVALLLGRVLLSQMDVPTRQAYLATLVPPSALPAAAAVTNAARTAARPVGPWVAGLTVGTASSGLPFLIAGVLKTVYDLALWRRFRLAAPATRPRRPR